MTGDLATRDVLLLAADLSERRLLFGELQETGYQVLPVAGLSVALGALLQGLVKPRLILINVEGDEHATPRSVESLMGAAPHVPVILVVGAIGRSHWEPLRGRVAELLSRPITFGEIVEAVKRILPLTRTV